MFGKNIWCYHEKHFFDRLLQHNKEKKLKVFTTSFYRKWITHSVGTLSNYESTPKTDRNNVSKNRYTERVKMSKLQGEPEANRKLDVKNRNKIDRNLTSLKPAAVGWNYWVSNWVSKITTISKWKYKKYFKHHCSQIFVICQLFSQLPNQKRYWPKNLHNHFQHVTNPTQPNPTKTNPTKHGCKDVDHRSCFTRSQQSRRSRWQRRQSRRRQQMSQRGQWLPPHWWITW